MKTSDLGEWWQKSQAQSSGVSIVSLSNFKPQQFASTVRFILKTFSKRSDCCFGSWKLLCLFILHCSNQLLVIHDFWSTFVLKWTLLVMWRSLRSRWDYLRYPFPELSVCLFALQAAQIPPDQKRSPAGIRLKQRIYPYLLRSRKAADQFPACLQVHILNYFTSVVAFGYHSFGPQLIHAQLGPVMPSRFY